MTAKLVRALPELKSPEQARDELAAARERLARSLETVEETLEPLSNWREAVRRNPWLAVGGAFLAGYALARLFSRR